MKIGDKIKIKSDVFAVSQKTQKSLANKKGIVKKILPKVGPLDMYIVKIEREELPICSSEIILDNGINK